MKYEYRCPKLDCLATVGALSEQRPLPVCPHGKPFSVHNQGTVMVQTKPKVMSETR